jgi:hypothetical protein
MTPEQRMWARVRKGLAPYLELQRVEDQLSAGIPDVFFAGPRPGSIANYPGIAGEFGWLELKRVPAWPKRQRTPVRVRHWTEVQRAWFRRYGAVRPRVFLLLQIARDTYLFDHVGADHVGELPRRGLWDVAANVWEGFIDWRELASLLLTYERSRGADSWRWIYDNDGG